MSLLKIIKVPDPRLKQKSAPVTDFDASLKQLVEDMAETMEKARGIGLAAIQVAVPKRLLLLDLGEIEDRDEGGEGTEAARARPKKTPLRYEAFVNPEILESHGEIEYEEGCLSIPGVYALIHRKEHLKLRYQDVGGKTHTIETQGMKSIVLQHEIDHLDGILFPDRLGPMKRMMVLNKYKKLQAEQDDEPA